MLRLPHVSVRALLRGVGPVTRRPERDGRHHRAGADDLIPAIDRADDRPLWIDSAVMARRIRDAHADPALRRDLDRLFPDTLADL